MLAPFVVSDLCFVASQTAVSDWTAVLGRRIVIEVAEGRRILDAVDLTGAVPLSGWRELEGVQQSWKAFVHLANHMVIVTIVVYERSVLARAAQHIRVLDHRLQRRLGHSMRLIGVTG